LWSIFRCGRSPSEIIKKAQQDTAVIFDISAKSGPPAETLSATGFGVAAGRTTPFLYIEVGKDSLFFFDIPDATARTFSPKMCKTYAVGDDRIP
jgi:hypothetical protein